jgi:aspartate aminotransferase
MSRLAARTSQIATSPTMQVTTTVERLKREGVAVLDLGAGEPDFGTPASIAAAAHEAIDKQFTKYTAVGGMQELKQAVVDRYRSDYGVQYEPSQVLITAGGKQALFNSALALFGPGDEVILHTPGWPTLVEQVKLANATPVCVRFRSTDGFALTAQPFVEAFTPRTRGIVLNTPCNPTGAVMAEDDLVTLAQEAAGRGIWIVVDLCYEKLIFESGSHNVPRVLDQYCPDLGVICGSASKAYAMTGWRCGWTIAPAPVIAAQLALQSHATSNVSSITQRAALEALRGSQEPVSAMRREYQTRRDAVHAWLTDEGLYGAALPPATFYLFVDVSRLLTPTGFRTSTAIAQALLDECRVAVTPGEAFEAPGFVRVSFATSMDVLREASARMVAFAKRHLAQPIGR